MSGRIRRHDSNMLKSVSGEIRVHDSSRLKLVSGGIWRYKPSRLKSVSGVSNKTFWIYSVRTGNRNWIGFYNRFGFTATKSFGEKVILRCYVLGGKESRKVVE